MSEDKKQEEPRELKKLDLNELAASEVYDPEQFLNEILRTAMDLGLALRAVTPGSPVLNPTFKYTVDMPDGIAEMYIRKIPYSEKDSPIILPEDKKIILN